MTALREYQRLEAAGLWRADAEAQRREVIVSLGDATLTITDTADRPLAHWSLAAIARANPGQFPALYHPDGDPTERLELAADEEQMIAAIERLRRAIERRRPRPGRLRLASVLAVSAVLAALALFWLPGAMTRHALAVVPPVKRAEIGADLLARIETLAGAPCADPAGRSALRRLGDRVLGPGRGGALIVLREGLTQTAHLPGRRILLGRPLVEDPQEPDVTAAFVLAEALRMRSDDPLRPVLRHAGLLATFRLLTTGALPDGALQGYAEKLLTDPPAPLDDDVLLKAFAEAELRSSPYAYALDVTGETTLALIEADPFAARPPRPVLSDADWLRLQGICGG